MAAVRPMVAVRPKVVEAVSDEPFRTPIPHPEPSEPAAFRRMVAACRVEPSIEI